MDNPLILSVSVTGQSDVSLLRRKDTVGRGGWCGEGIYQVHSLMEKEERNSCRKM